MTAWGFGPQGRRLPIRLERLPRPVDTSSRRPAIPVAPEGDVMRKVISSVSLTVALFASGLVVGGALSARADQPHMQRALDQLRGALGELQEASHDKGGHRAQAMQLVKQAIEQVQLGIDVGRE
jgi:hypothetical protein